MWRAFSFREAHTHRIKLMKVHAQYGLLIKSYPHLEHLMPNRSPRSAKAHYVVSSSTQGNREFITLPLNGRSYIYLRSLIPQRSDGTSRWLRHG